MADVDIAPDVLIEDSKCEKCIPYGMQLEVIIFLLQQLSGNTMTPKELMEASKCNRCIPRGTQPEIIIYLLDQLKQLST